MKNKGLIFDIKRDSHEDGPGIRTTVFFKGCPLSCVWCHNPEGRDSRPGLSFNAKACKSPDCGYPCMAQCKNNVIHKAVPVKIDHSLCNRCDKCFNACSTKALEPVGRWFTVDDLLSEVTIDKSFFTSTGGGVTLSGGESTMQMEFIGSFLRALKYEQIHTAIETCGYFDYLRFSKHVLPFLDLIYFDLKLIDDTESLKYTGQSNRIILENFSRLVQDVDIPVVPRVPLIPNITVTRENLMGIASFLRKHNVSDCVLMPYNPLWYGKLHKFGINADYQYDSFMDKDEEKACVDLLFQ